MRIIRANLVIGIIAGAAILCVVAFGSDAQAPSKRVKLERRHVESVDCTNMTFTVKFDGTNDVPVYYDAKTRFYIDRMPAVSKDLEPSDHVSGALLLTGDGQLRALRIRIVKLAPK